MPLAPWALKDPAALPATVDCTVADIPVPCTTVALDWAEMAKLGADAESPAPEPPLMLTVLPEPLTLTLVRAVVAPTVPPNMVVPVPAVVANVCAPSTVLPKVMLLFVVLRAVAAPSKVASP